MRLLIEISQLQRVTPSPSEKGPGDEALTHA